MKKRTKRLASAFVALAFFAALRASFPAGRQALAFPSEETSASAADRSAGDLCVIDVNGVSYRFRWAPPGAFRLGCSELEQNQGFFEAPCHVTLTEGFWILETEVTQSMWTSVMGHNPSRLKGANLPVETVSWNDCQEFVAQLNQLGAAPVGFRFSLPTEAQWEYACRAGTTTSFFWSDALNGDKANCRGTLFKGVEQEGVYLGRTTPTGSYEANPWGVYDMHGNVFEWCDDGCYVYESAAPATDPRGPDDGRIRMIRGGGWDSDVMCCRSARRDGCEPDGKNSNIGLRLVLVPFAGETAQEAAAPAEESAADGDRQEAAATVEEQPGADVEKAPTPDAGSRAGDLRVIDVNGVSYRFRWAPPGSFTMGSSDGEAGRGDDEAAREVALTRGFWMLETEVTQAMWESVMGDNPSYFKGPDLPVECVSWDACQEFVAKFNAFEVAPAGYSFALPTEAQWEYACRADTTSPFFWGDSLNGDKANCNGENPYGTDEKGAYLRKTSPAGSYAANPWGLFDMHGNVSEWCEDRHGFYYPSDSATDPRGPESAYGGPRRIQRGGGWYSFAKYCRSACRSSSDVDSRSSNVGFRFVLVPIAEELNQGETAFAASADEKADAVVEQAPVPAEWTSLVAGREPGEELELVINGLSYYFRWAPPGRFTMGCAEKEQEDELRAFEEDITRDHQMSGAAISDAALDGPIMARRAQIAKETQPHEVTFTHGFWMLETEVTQRMWDSIMGDNPIVETVLELPVGGVSWLDCQQFVFELNRLGAAPAGSRFALPTEAQWEYACRADTTTIFSWGDSLNGEKANCDGTRPYGTEEKGPALNAPTPVGVYGANPWRFYDMHGNVAEWCEDKFGDYPPTAATDPRGTDVGAFRALRGGCSRVGAMACR